MREAAGASGQRRHGPLLEVRWALWVFLQRLHDLTLVQHESHELVLPLGPGGGTVERPDELQLLQVLEGLGRGDDQSEAADGLFRSRVCQSDSNLHDDGWLKVVHGAGLALQELLELCRRRRRR